MAPGVMSHRLGAQFRAGLPAPRGPPWHRVPGLGSGNAEPSQDTRKAPRMAGTIRDHKLQSEVNRCSVPHCARVIKTPLTPYSRKNVGRCAARLDRETSLRGCDARSICNERPRPSLVGDTCQGRAGLLALTRTSPSRTGQPPTSRESPSGTVARGFSMCATIQVSGAKARPRIASIIRGRKGKPIWLRQQYWRPRLR
jgi:hypothetical protein